MSDLRIVTTDVDPASPDYGSLRAVAPGSATALPIPSFRLGASTPVTGTVVGEGFINSVTGAASVWDGNQWHAIVQGALLSYPTDADVIADTMASNGSYATSFASGNLFVKGGTGWRQIGVRTYTTAVALLADSAAPEGSLGVAEDEETFWVMHSGTWHCHSRRPFADIVAVQAWANPPEGSIALEMAEELRYHYHSGSWRPETIWIKTEADILAATDRLDGQMAVASDTGRVYVFHSGVWMASQIEHYPTEQALLAATPTDGILAWANDNGLIYTRFNGQWRRANAPTVTIAATAPATPANGDLFYDTAAGVTTIFDGTNWQPVAAGARAPTTAPANPVDGDLWLDTSGAAPVLKVYEGTAWNPIKGGAAVSNTAPAGPSEGDLWLDTSVAAPVLKVYKGTAWNPVTEPPVTVGTNTRPSSPKNGDLFYANNKERLEVFRNNHWGWASPGAVWAHSFSIGNGTQVMNNFPPEKKPTRYISFRGFAYTGGGPAKLGIMGQQFSGGWIDWDALCHWGHFIESPHNSGSSISQSVESMAEGNGGLNLMYHKANGATSIVFDVRIDLGPSSEPILTSEVMFIASGVRYHSKLMTSMVPGQINSNTQSISGLGLKVMSGAAVAARGQFEWA